MSFRSRLRETSGFSLIEVVLVILIMGILASVAAQKYSGAIEQSRFDATRAEMERLAIAVTGDAALTSGGVRSDFGYVGDVGALPPNLDALVSNPGGYVTWDGPYIQSDFQQNPNDYKEDAWGQGYGWTGLTLTSSGSGSAVTKSIASASSDLLQNSVAGSITDGLNNVPGDSSVAVTVTLFYPNGAGAMTTASTQPSSGGSFDITNTVPVGNHLLRVTYHADTVERYVSVLPASTAIANVRLPGDLWTPAGGGPGGGPGGLTYVAGSATAPGGYHHLQFQVQNQTGSPIDLTSIQLTYSAPMYFQQILMAGSQKFSSSNPRGASGEIKSFSTVTVNNGASLIIDYQTFKQCVSGNCGNGNVGGESFTALFSDGSSVTFTVP